MDSDEANKRTELIAGLVRAGGKYDWKTSPIGETREAHLTDPTRLARDRWWVAAEPDSLAEFKRVGENFLANLKKFAGRAKDGKEEEQRAINPHAGKDKKRGKKKDSAAGDEKSFEEYLPESGELIHEWLKDFSTKVNMNVPARAPWFKALRSYVAKYTAETKAGELDQNTLGALVRMICSESEEAA